MTEEAPKPGSGRGGKRPGAGRKKKGHIAPTSIAGLDLKSAREAVPPDRIEPVAGRDINASLDALVKQLLHGASETAKIAAANEILDRGYGKPAVDLGGDAMLPFMAAPTIHPVADIRAEARKCAHLAVDVLRKIRDNGQSETARVSAAKSLLARSLGTVAPAKVPDDFGYRPIGKKEEAARAARTAGEGTDWGDDLRPPSTAQHVN